MRYSIIMNLTVQHPNKLYFTWNNLFLNFDFFEIILYLVFFAYPTASCVKLVILLESVANHHVFLVTHIFNKLIEYFHIFIIVFFLILILNILVFFAKLSAQIIQKIILVAFTNKNFIGFLVELFLYPFVCGCLGIVSTQTHIIQVLLWHLDLDDVSTVSHLQYLFDIHDRLFWNRFG
jgi:hypothetical protein